MRPAEGTLRYMPGAGAGIGVVGVALALRPPTPVSELVFWLVLGSGGLATVVGAATIAFRRIRWRRPSQVPTPNREPHLVARECERFADMLADALAEHRSKEPRPRPFGNGAARRQQWVEEMTDRYRREFRDLALKLFDTAAQLGGVSTSSRALVEAPSPRQLHTLPGLFRDAAKSLKRV